MIILSCWKRGNVTLQKKHEKEHEITWNVWCDMMNRQRRGKQLKWQIRKREGGGQGEHEDEEERKRWRWDGELERWRRGKQEIGEKHQEKCMW